MRKVRVFATAALAYRDIARALNAMPMLILVTVLISVGAALTDWAFELSSETSSAPLSRTLLIKLVLGVAETILLAPAFIAVYRWLILDEVSRGYALEPNEPRFKVFSAWAVVLFLITEYSTSVILSFVPASPALNIWLTLALVTFGIMVTAWTALLLPAVAVDAPGASWHNAVADMRGVVWRALAVLVLTVLPMLVVMAAILQATGDSPAVAAFLSALAGPASTLVWSAAAARMYQTLAVTLMAAPQ